MAESALCRGQRQAAEPHSYAKNALFSRGGAGLCAIRDRACFDGAGYLPQAKKAAGRAAKTVGGQPMKL